MSRDAEEILMSSPDPLANSADVTPTSSPSKPSRRFCPAEITPKRNVQLPIQTVQLQDIVISTPSANLNALQLSPGRSTARTDRALSPWRIRVTVEAERDEKGNGMGKGARKMLDFKSPSKESKLRTTTTVIPVKGLESSPPPSKRRGRPRKSATTPVKRTGTPRASRKSQRFSLEQSFRDITQDEDTANPTRNVSPPFKSGGHPRAQADIVAVEAPQKRRHHAALLSTRPLKSSEICPSRGAAEKRLKGMRYTASPVKIAVDPNVGSPDIVPSEELATAGNLDQVLGDIDVNSATSSSESSNQQLPENEDRDFGSTPETGKAYLKRSGAAPTATKGISPRKTRSKVTSHPSGASGYSIKNIPTEDTVLERAMSKSDGLHSIANTVDRVEKLDHSQGMESFDEHSTVQHGSNDVANLREMDSILESEGFSMVSITSITSAKDYVNGLAYERPRNQPEQLIAKGESPNSGATAPLSQRSAESLSANHMNRSSHGKKIRQEKVAFEEAISDYPKSSMLMALTKSPKPPTKHRLERQASTTEDDESASTNQNDKLIRTGAEIRSSPPVRAANQQSQICQQTPSAIKASPTLPPPLRPTSTKKSQTPRLASVIGTGIALQGILSKDARFRSPCGSPVKDAAAGKKNPKERLDDLFSGFGDGTRRELRAGLKLGEELAKRQADASRSKDTVLPVELSRPDDVFAEQEPSYPRLPSPKGQGDYSLSLPAQEPQKVAYPALRSPEQLITPVKSSEGNSYDVMSWRVDTPVKVLHREGPSQAETGQDVGNETNWSTMEGREAKWQREREAVSRQIEDANKSQVIVIDDTTVVIGDNEGSKSCLSDEPTEAQSVAQQDIWRAEAFSTSPTPSPGPAASQDPYPTVEMLKPPRGKIPSPWRRDSEMIYSDEVVEDESALFWQPDTCSKEAFRAREERRRRKDEMIIGVPPFPSPQSPLMMHNRALEEASMVSRDSKGCTQHGAAADVLNDSGESSEDESLEQTPLEDDPNGRRNTVRIYHATTDEEDLSEVDGDEETDHATSDASTFLADSVARANVSRARPTEATSIVVDTSSQQVVRQLNVELEAVAVSAMSLPEPHPSKPPLPVPPHSYRSRFLSSLSAITPSFLQPQSKPPTSSTTIQTTHNRTSTNQQQATLIPFPSSARLTYILSQHSDDLTIREPWSIANYKLIKEMYLLARAASCVPTKYTTHRYYGRDIVGKGHRIVLGCRELWTVDIFEQILKAESPEGRNGGEVEFEEWYLARRVFSLVYAEECRRERQGRARER